MFYADHPPLLNRSGDESTSSKKESGRPYLLLAADFFTLKSMIGLMSLAKSKLLLLLRCLVWF